MHNEVLQDVKLLFLARLERWAVKSIGLKQLQELLLLLRGQVDHAWVSAVDRDTVLK